MTTFVDVIVDATGARQQVPADFIGHPVLGKGITLAPADDVPPPPPAPVEGPSDVQLTGPVEDLPLVPAVRDAVLAARAEAAAALAAGPPTEDDKAAVIDKFAADHDIDLGAARTKAEKVEVINTHLAEVGTVPTDEIPATGEQE